MIQSAKRVVERVGIKFLSSITKSPWSRKNTTHLLIRTFEGFGRDLWLDAMAIRIPKWQTQLEIVTVSSSLGFYKAILGADACLTMEVTDHCLDLSSRLRWIHTILAGVDSIHLPMPPESLRITTSRGIAARSMAEHILALMYAVKEGLFRHSWPQIAWGTPWVLSAPAEWTLEGYSVAILGMGCVGMETARICKEHRMSTVGVSRRLQTDDTSCDQQHVLSDLHKVLPHVDFVVLSLPLTPSTYHIIGQRELLLMKPGATLINVARGDLIDEKALADALRTGQIAGAGLDVLAEEPPSRNHPLNHCANLVVTGHVAGNIHRFKKEIADRFARNLDAFLTGKELEGIVSREYWI
jgi:phosphoglycerate dehydrogenase-like enzyme